MRLMNWTSYFFNDIYTSICVSYKGLSIIAYKNEFSKQPDEQVSRIFPGTRILPDWTVYWGYCSRNYTYATSEYFFYALKVEFTVFFLKNMNVSVFRIKVNAIRWSLFQWNNFLGTHLKPPSGRLALAIILNTIDT